MKYLLLFCFFILSFSLLVSSRPILGAYGGGGNPASVTAFGQWLGREVKLGLDFLSLNDWAGLHGNAEQFKAWAGWLNAKPDRMFVLSIAMIPLSGGGDLVTGANGGYNSVFTDLANSLVSNGLKNNVILRIGWEMNGDWYPWKASADPSAWVKYFRNIVGAMRAVNPAFKVLWNIQVNWTPLNPTTVYPGSDVVDYIGIDVYDTCYDANLKCTAYLSGHPEGGTWNSQTTYPANTLVDWAGAFYINPSPSKGQQPGQGGWNLAFDAATLQQSRTNTFNNLNNGYLGLSTWSAFAKQQGKPVAIGEMGVFLTTNGGGDDPYYIQQMYNWVNDPANNVAWVSYWDYGEQQLSPKNGLQPSINAANTFKKTFATLP